MFGLNSNNIIKQLVNDKQAQTNINKSSIVDNSFLKGLYQLYPKSPEDNNIKKKQGVKDNRIKQKETIQFNFNEDGEANEGYVFVPDLFTLREVEINFNFFNFHYHFFNYWYYLIKQSLPQLLSVHPSNVGSLHDRACEIFYELKGGQVNYGLQHSKKYCHSQYGAKFEGSYKQWNQDNPINFIGKGYGIQTILYLQYLLAIDYFKSNTNEKWIKSVISINGSFHGSTLFYILGLKYNTKSVISPISILQLLITFIHILLYLDIGFILNLFNLNLMNSYWNLSWKNNSFLCALLARSSYSQFEDNFLYDFSIEGSQFNNTLYPQSNHCLYLNYIITPNPSPQQSNVSGYYLPNVNQNIIYIILSWLMGKFQFPKDTKMFSSSSKYWFNYNGHIPIVCQLPPYHHQIQFQIELNNQFMDPILFENENGKWITIFTNINNIRLFQTKQQFIKYSKSKQFNYQFINNLLKWMIEVYEYSIIFIYSLQQHPYLFIIYYCCLPIFYLFNIKNINKQDFKYFNLNCKSDDNAILWLNKIQNQVFLHSPSNMIRWFNQNNN